MEPLLSSGSNPSSTSIDFNNLKFLAVGKSGIVYKIDDKSVLKEYHGEETDYRVERRAFERLGSHAHIVEYLGTIDDSSIILQRGQPIRSVLQQCTSADQIPLDTKIRWLRDAAEGLRHIHQNGIIHADVGCNNMILVSDCVKIIDFEGCSIDGDEATSCYEWFSYQESTPAISQRTDIFAYGCAVYEIMAGKPPYNELASAEDSRRLVRELYAKRQFPETIHLPLHNLMQGCWNGTFGSMSEVLKAVEIADVA